MDINWHTFFFLLFATISCAFAVGVVVSSNIVRMAAYLIVSLGAVAGLHFLAGADFVGAMQLMIYVGGTLVLLVFGVMLTAQGPYSNLKISKLNWAMTVVAGGALLLVLLFAALGVEDWRSTRVAEAHLAAGGNPVAESPHTVTPIGLGLLGLRVDQLEQDNPVLREGMSGYLLPFEIVSVHLLVVLIGAAYLARARKRMPKPE